MVNVKHKDMPDKAEEYRLIAKELRWLARHFRNLYEMEMQARGIDPKPDDEDPNQLKLEL